MVFKFIDEILGFFTDLRFLERNSQPYRALLYQHRGRLYASTQHIGNPPDDPDAARQLSSFFRLAREKNVDLVLTPEYCCPWSVIETIVADPAKWPESRKLWAIGGESIQKAQLSAFKQTNHHGNVFVFFDEGLLNKANNFFDPLVYLFQSDIGGVTRLNVIVQVKTHHMSVWSGGEVERNNIILGEEIYILRNANDSINFFTLVCSEAMNFQAFLLPELKRKLAWQDNPYLIFNPQLNGSPTHINFTRFRSVVMEKLKKEIIGLNWNVNSQIRNTDTPIISGGNSRSGFVIHSDEINLTDYNKIRRNHSKGLYYLNYGIANRHAFLCNSFLDAILLKVPAVDIDNVLLQQSRRDGPDVIATFCLDEQFELIDTVTPVSDSSIPYLTEAECHNEFLVNPDNCIIEKERLVCLTTIEISKGTSQWYELNNLSSIRIDESTEVNRRITYAEDSVAPSIEVRKKYVRTLNDLEHILNNRQDIFPENIHVLKPHRLKVGYHQTMADNKKMIETEKFKYNITTEAGARIDATICFLDHPTKKELKEKFDIIQDLFGENPRRSRAMIFYRQDQEIKVMADPSPGNFTDGLENLGPVINKS